MVENSTQTPVGPDRPVIVVSLPKCGTYLVAEVLKALGCRWTGMHIGQTGFSDYSGADIVEARRNPARFTRKEPLCQSLTRIQSGEFGVGHLPFHEESLRATENFKRVYLTRELRPALVSYMRFVHSTGRMGAELWPWYSIPNLRKRLLVFLMTTAPLLFVQLYEGMVGWSQVDGILHVRFEDLTGDAEQAVPVVESIARFLGVDGGDARKILESSLAAQTITKSEGLTRLEEYWSREAERKFAEIGGVELEARLRCVVGCDARDLSNHPPSAERAA